MTTLLRDEFALKFSELNVRIGTEDDSIDDLEARAAPSFSSLAARVSVLESRPAVVLGPGPSLPPETSPDGNETPNGDPPLLPPPANHPPVRPWVDTAASSPTVCFGQDGLSPKDRARIAWANSPSGQAAAAQAPAPPQPRPLDTPPIPASTPPRYAPAQPNTNDATPGGPIVSPRQGNHEGQARRLGASRFDIVRLATPDYHIGTHGIAVLTHAILVKCGYNQITSSDVVTCHNDIIAVHRKVRELWFNPTSHTYGPHVERIVTKSLKLLPTLDSADTASMVDFYDRLQESASGLTIALMPFDTVMIRYGLEGLCVPGLGVDKYHAMSKALMELLPRLVSGNLSPQINAALALVRLESGNGYDFLWRVLELTVPGFDPVVPINVPQWANSDDIFSFAQAYLLHFRLQAKMNFHYGDRTRAGIFLHAIQSSEFADTVTTL